MKGLADFRLLWRNYIFQSLLATLTVFIVLLFLSLEQAVIIASIGASAFIVFAMPESITAKPRNVIGGHMVGLLSGSLSALLPHSFFLQSILAYSLAVGISTLIMVVVDVEHPPAAGTALGVAIKGLTLNSIIAVVTSALILSLVHRLFKPFLKDLT
ncbi:HPP family protein [Candidatus Bathyarchaeota archaeon]|nr:HPP family protein [Candidatus Bathyarchaeota archaeon]